MKSTIRIRIGIILILFGVITILSNFGLLNEYFTLPFISAGFFGMYFMTGGRKRGNIGFLIPACILLFIGVYAYIEENYSIAQMEGSLFFFFLGTAFLAIYFIHSFWHKGYSFGSRHWSLITAICIYLFGIFIFAIEFYEWEIGEKILNSIWPVVLIITGVSMMVKSHKEKKLKDKE